MVNIISGPYDKSDKELVIIELLRSNITADL